MVGVLGVSLIGLAGVTVPKAALGEAPREPSVARAEREFSAYTVQHGMKKGFLAYFAETSTLFTPLPSDARRWLKALPDDPSPPTRSLAWEPIVAGESPRGEMGFTTGPYTLRGADDGVLERGFFFSVWTRCRHQPWRVRVDIGQPGAPAKEERKRKGLKVIPPVTRPKAPRLPNASRDDLLGLDRTVGGRGAVRYASDAVLVLGKVGLLEGQAAIRAALARSVTPSRWVPLEAASSEYGQMAWVYGRYRVGRDEGNYVRVWTRDGRGIWRIVAEIRQDPPPRSG